MKFITDNSWTLFLDRDGTINERLPGAYIWNYSQFNFLPGALESIPIFNKFFDRVIIVTNQQGIGKEIMSEKMLHKVHDRMLEHIHLEGGFIHEIYYCPELEIHNPLCRKPNPGMALQAQKDFPEIEFRKSIMVGDTSSDMKFGRNLGMKTVWIKNSMEQLTTELESLVDIQTDSLLSFAYDLMKQDNR